jgi:hypothetical protein
VIGAQLPVQEWSRLDVYGSHVASAGKGDVEPEVQRHGNRRKEPTIAGAIGAERQRRNRN